ncbi:MAG: hypothetical protein IJR66_04475 [Clostridia bacterium]|nr:hypothetical protein [Clostridia bacterium]MBQ9514212.1 hypothetical protein [Clostridia bacterium]
MKNLVKGYDNEYSAPEIIISQTLGDVIMSSGDSNSTVNDGYNDAPPGISLG